MVDMLPSFNCKINHYRHYSMTELPIILTSNEQDVNSALDKVLMLSPLVGVGAAEDRSKRDKSESAKAFSASLSTLQMWWKV
jgi:hypothetical protein